MLVGLASYSKVRVQTLKVADEGCARYPKIKLINLFAGVTLLFLWSLTAFRSDGIGNDTRNYIYYFEIFVRNGMRADYFEVGYRFLNVLIGKVTTSPHAFLIIITSILYVISALYLYRYSKNVLMSLCLFFCVCFSLFASTLRQDIAMLIAVYGYYQLKEGRKFKAVLVFFAAMLFHTSAAVCFLLFIDTRVLTRRWTVLGISAALVIFSMSGLFNVFFTSVLPQQFARYFVGQYASSGWLAVTYELIRNVVFFLILNRAADLNQRSDRLAVANMVFLVLICSLGYSVNLFTRASEYFLVISVFELPNYLYSPKIRNRRLLGGAICSAMLLMFIAVLVFRPGWNHLYPYELWRNG